MLDLRRTALLVIDMQRDFCAPGGYADQAGLNIDRLRAPIPVIARLLAHARALGLLVVHRILQLHHRRIVLADSEAGAVFVFSLAVAGRRTEPRGGPD